MIFRKIKREQNLLFHHKTITDTELTRFEKDYYDLITELDNANSDTYDQAMASLSAFLLKYDT